MADPEEKKESVTENKPVTDTELDSAWPELFEEKKEVKVEKKEEKKETKPEPTEEEKEEHKERSQLGRRVARMETKIDDWLQRMESVSSKTSKTAVETSTDGELPEVVTTPEDVRKINEYDRKKEAEQKKSYSDGYLKKVNSFSKVETELHDEIFKEMTANWESNPFNKVITGDPNVDAELNYEKAKTSILSKKLAAYTKPKPNVKGEKPVASTNLSVTSKEEPESPEGPELDEFAKDFVKRTGMAADSIKDALKGEVPLNLMGSKR